MRINTVKSGFVVFAIVLCSLCPSPFRAASPEIEADWKGSLESLLRSPCLRKARVAVRVVSLADGRVLYDRNGSEPLVPASNVKIFTAATALKVLGTDYRFSTTFHADTGIEDRVLAGDLYLKGWGAPDLVGEFWWLMAQELRRMGLTKVSGDLVLDDTHFDDEPRPAGWPRAIVDRAYNAPLSALSCNYNVVTVRVVPGAASGERPEVQLIPYRAHLGVKNQASTKKGRAGVSVFRVPGGGGEQILVRGSVRPGGRPVETIRSIDHPTLYAGHAFREVATEVGIEFDGDIRLGTVPDAAEEIYRFRSKPLSAIIRDMNKYSNNFIAEMLVKGLDAHVGHIPASTEGGLEVILPTLRDAGVDLEGVVIRDGSGLAEGNRATAASLTSALETFGRDFEVFPELFASLPVAGIDGTLEDRDADAESTRKVRAKTGRLAGADSLSGYTATEAGEILAFSLIVNGSRCSHETVAPILDRLADRISAAPAPQSE
jgi:D-alanyl-D-alanine carboxypeptidase/D-alanyl-D-alanine-endopeptidase (penicillin-binding protein 4)